MSAAHWIVIAAVALAAWLVLLWWLPGARPRIRVADADDLTALIDATQRPKTVLVVERLATGKLNVTYSDIWVSEALDIGTQCIQAAMAAQYEHVGICEAETYANKEM